MTCEPPECEASLDAPPESFTLEMETIRNMDVESEMPLGMLWEVGSSPGNIMPSGQLTKTSPDDAKWGGICFQGKSLPDPYF